MPTPATNPLRTRDRGTMHDLSSVTELPDDFDGRVRLFPLPGLVLFPHAMQPLHIFEPRYCEMLLESLAGDQLIAMATFRDGAAAQTSDQPTSDQPTPDQPPLNQPPLNQPRIDQTVCIGKVISHAQVEGDRHNILLVGTQRARIRCELDAGRPFRIGEVDVLPDIYPPSGSESRRTLKQELLGAFGEIVPATAAARKNLHELMAGQMGLGPITDIIAYTLPFDVTHKLALLSEVDVDDRARKLIELLRGGGIDLHSVSVEEQTLDNSGYHGDDDPKFPPPFSLN